MELGSQHETVVLGDRAGVANHDENERHTVMFANSGAPRRFELSLHVDGYQVYERVAEYGVDDWQVLGILDPQNYALRLATRATTHTVEIPRETFRCKPSKRYVALGDDGVGVSDSRRDCSDA